LHDHSGKANWGTLTNMDAATDWVVSNGKNALDFDGSNDYVLAGASQFSNADDIAISVTMIQRTRPPGANSAIFDLISPVRSFTLQQSEAGGGTFVFTDGVDGANNISVSAAEQASLNVVNHLVLQFRGVAYQWIVNGVVRKSGNVGSRVGGSVSSINIGRRVGLQHIDMVLFDAAIYRRTLSLDEVRLLARGPGIAYKPRRRRRIYSLGPSFNAAWARGSNVIIQPSVGVA
jgi:hypothetical protein